LKKPFNFDEITTVAEEVKEQHEKGIDVPSKDRKEFNEDLFEDHVKDDIEYTKEEMEEDEKIPTYPVLEKED